jgi:hypothetical protein
MRLSRTDLFAITHRKRPLQQAAWFKQYLGIIIPCDREGPILTPSTYEGLLAKRLGLAQKGGEASAAREGDVLLLAKRAPKQRTS